MYRVLYRVHLVEGIFWGVWSVAYRGCRASMRCVECAARVDGVEQ